MARGPEEKVVAAIRKRLAQVGALVVRVPRTRFTVAGVSDLLVCYRGRFIAIECKAPTGSYDVTSAQCMFLLNVAGAGGRWCVARGVEDVDKLLASLNDDGTDKSLPG
jgi:Holliday junction resolvase